MFNFRRFYILFSLLAITCSTGSESVVRSPAELERHGGVWSILDPNSQEQIGQFAIWTAAQVTTEGKLFTEIFSGCQNPMTWQPVNEGYGLELSCNDRKIELNTEAGGRIRLTDHQNGTTRESKYLYDKKLNYQQYSAMARIDTYLYFDPELPQCFPAQSVEGRDMRASTIARSNANCAAKPLDSNINGYLLDCDTRPFAYLADTQTCTSTVAAYDNKLRELNKNVGKRWNGKWSIMGRPDSQLITRSVRGKLEVLLPLTKKKTATISIAYDAASNYFIGKATETFNGDFIERHIVLRFVEENLLLYESQIVVQGRSNKFQSPPYSLEERAKRIK